MNASDKSESSACDKQSPSTACRADGRCQYAIDHGAEGLGHCPVGECVQPSDPADIYEEEYTTQSSVGGTHEHSHRAALAAVVAAISARSAIEPPSYTAGRQRQADAEALYRMANMDKEELDALGIESRAQAIEYAADQILKNTLVVSPLTETRRMEGSGMASGPEPRCADGSDCQNQTGCYEHGRCERLAAARAEERRMQEFIRISVLGRGDVPMDVREAADGLLKNQKVAPTCGPSADTRLLQVIRYELQRVLMGAPFDRERWSLHLEALRVRLANQPDGPHGE